MPQEATAASVQKRTKDARAAEKAPVGDARVGNRQGINAWEGRVAVMAFLLSLGLVFVLIGNDFHQPWGPTIVVLAYSASLVMLSKRNIVSLSSEVVNSPYYLGFLSALVSIFFAFRQHGPDLTRVFCTSRIERLEDRKEPGECRKRRLHRSRL